MVAPASATQWLAGSGGAWTHLRSTQTHEFFVLMLEWRELHIFPEIMGLLALCVINTDTMGFFAIICCG